MLKPYLEVGVYGRSVFLLGIEAVLKKQEGIRVCWLGNTLEEVLWEIVMLSPHIILFENRSASQTVITSIMQQFPAIKLIGLEAERDRATVISCQEQTITSGEQLLQILLESMKS